MSTALAPTTKDRWSDREMVDTLKQTVCKGASDAQFRMFVEVCRSTGLNPWLKEIWFVAEKNMIMAGRDGYLRVANEHPQFDGMKTVVERDEKNIPIKATCTVWRKDRGHPIECEAFYNEYAKNSPVWTTYKSAMISKVSEVLALKRSFCINGVVTEEEVGVQAESEPVDIGPHRINTQAAADYVAEKKIEEMKRPRPALTEAKPPAQAEEIPEDVQRMWSEMKDFKSTLSVFAALKKSLAAAYGTHEGERLYYDALGHAGVIHSNEFKSTRPARQAAKEMLEMVRSAAPPAPEDDPLHVSEADIPAEVNR